jgi:hypothetical protein
MNTLRQKEKQREQSKQAETCAGGKIHLLCVLPLRPSAEKIKNK